MNASLHAALVGLIALLMPLPTGAQIDRPVFLDREGRPLPIQNEQELAELLRSAREIGSRPIGEGVTGGFRLELEEGGITVRAAFHHIDRHEMKTKRLPNNKIVAYMRDSYTSQVAAYRLGRLLGMRNIPPTVLRRSQNLAGSAQLWIEKAMTETERKERGIQPPDINLWNQLYCDMRVFDNLINNIDRNSGNMLFDSRGYLWLIDHTRSFGKDKGLPRPDTITRCSWDLYEAIEALDEQSVRQQLRPPDQPKSQNLLTVAEITALFARRDKLITLLDERIRSQGEGMVLFHYGDPDPYVKVDKDLE